MSDFKPKVVSKLDEIIERDGKKKPKPKEAKTDQGQKVDKVEGTNIQNHGTMHYHAPPSVDLEEIKKTVAAAIAPPSAVPEVKPVQKMNEEERKAFQTGEWDGLERRDRDNDTKDYRKALRKRTKRKSDREIVGLHYGVVVGLFLTLFISFCISMILTLGASA